MKNDFLYTFVEINVASSSGKSEMVVGMQSRVIWFRLYTKINATNFGNRDMFIEINASCIGGWSEKVVGPRKRGLLLLSYTHKSMQHRLMSKIHLLKSMQQVVVGDVRGSKDNRGDAIFYKDT